MWRGQGCHGADTACPTTGRAQALTSPSRGQDGGALGRTKEKGVKSAVQVVLSEGKVRET